MKRDWFYSGVIKITARASLQTNKQTIKNGRCLEGYSLNKTIDDDDDDADDSGLTFPSSLGMRALQKGVASPSGWS